jgi:hypothetical protein
MIDSGAKISVQDTEEGQLITIYPQLKAWQKIALRVWIAIWAVTGLLGIMSMLGESVGDQYLYLFVFTVLWIYFLYYAIRSVVWHQNGHEKLRIGSENLDYKRSWGSYGKAVSYDLGTIKNLALVNLDGKTFAKTYQDAFWTVGGEKIGFEYLGKKVVIGLRLTDKEAKDVVKRINRGKRKPAK